MPDLRIQTAKDNGDLPKDHGQDYKELTLEDAINPTVIKAYYEQFKKEFNRPSVFEKNRGQDK